MLFSTAWRGLSATATDPSHFFGHAVFQADMMFDQHRRTDIFKLLAGFLADFHLLASAAAVLFIFRQVMHTTRAENAPVSDNAQNWDAVLSSPMEAHDFFLFPVSGLPAAS